MPFWFCLALSSFSACDALAPFGLVGLGAVNGVQPSAGSTNESSRPLSLPLVSTVSPGRLAWLAAVAWRGLAGVRVEQVVRHRVVALVLVDQG